MARKQIALMILTLMLSSILAGCINNDSDEGDSSSDDENKEKLKSEMRRLGFEEMPAYFVCVLVMITSKDDPLPLYVEGRSNGIIKTKSIGDHGFGYDDMFYPDGYSESFASINASTKLKLSHRGKAFAVLKDKLK